jgi:hypothetical protein
LNESIDRHNSRHVKLAIFKKLSRSINLYELSQNEFFKQVIVRKRDSLELTIHKTSSQSRETDIEPFSRRAQRIFPESLFDAISNCIPKCICHFQNQNECNLHTRIGNHISNNHADSQYQIEYWCSGASVWGV